jgi:O-succinylbenzoate synthase
LAVRVEEAELRLVRMRMKEPFTTSFGTEWDKVFWLVVLRGEGLEGFGECVASPEPLYSEETNASAGFMLEEILLPAVLGRTLHPDELEPLFRPYRGNRMAKAAVENALWDLESRKAGLPLWQAIGGVRDRVPVGISIGLQASVDDLLRKVEHYLEAGYRRIKLKIRPGEDVELVRAVRRAFGDVPLMVDANSAYRLADLPVFLELDAYGLTMIEQPLGHDDIVDHADLQRELVTPICLDESIHTPDDARKALRLGACRVINIKIGRMGGLGPSCTTAALAAEHGVGVWCGGMLESGIGRAHNLAVATLPNFRYPGDTAATSRYWDEDITEPPVVVGPDGTVRLSDRPGIGVDVIWERLDRRTVSRRVPKAP